MWIQGPKRPSPACTTTETCFHCCAESIAKTMVNMCFA